MKNVVMRKINFADENANTAYRDTVEALARVDSSKKDVAAALARFIRADFSADVEEGVSVDEIVTDVFADMTRQTRSSYMTVARYCFDDTNPYMSVDVDAVGVELSYTVLLTVCKGLNVASIFGVDVRGGYQRVHDFILENGISAKTSVSAVRDMFKRTSDTADTADTSANADTADTADTSEAADTSANANIVRAWLMANNAPADIIEAFNALF